jgi:hypothetical protein
LHLLCRLLFFAGARGNGIGFKQKQKMGCRILDPTGRLVYHILFEICFPSSAISIMT